MTRKPLPTPEVGRDFIFSFLIASVVMGGWASVYYYVGDKSNLNKDSLNFIGAILAVSGLLFRQYMIKEVLDYLNMWDKMCDVIDKIIKKSEEKNIGNKNEIMQFIHQKEHAEQYSRYVKAELVIVPFFPLIIIFLYGCALISDKSFWFRSSCLFGMIYCVSYLALVALTSSRIAYSFPNLKENVILLEDVHDKLCE